MGLNYPNHSRTFDTTRRLIRFWGYDSAIEVTFLLDTNALRKFTPETSDVDLNVLEVFDAFRERIHQVSDKIYFRQPKGSYTCNLVAADF